MKCVFQTFIFLCLVLLPSAFAGSVSEWMELEQKRVERTVDENKILAPDVQNQATKFRPESQEWFAVKAIWIPESELNVAIDESSLDSKLRKLFIRKRAGKREFRLLVHPESEKFYESLLKKYKVDNTTFRATSTASSRTVLMKAKGRGSNEKFFAKLSLDVELGGVRRTIPQGEVARSVGTSIYLDELEKRIGTERFVHMREPLGIAPRGWERGGMILRMIPNSIKTNQTKLVPLFSLYKIDENGRTLLQDMAEKANLSPEEFTKEFILKPFYEGWTAWNLEGSVVMEAHAQNVLLELDANGIPSGRFMHRDLGGFNIDGKNNALFEKTELPTFNGYVKDYHQNSSETARKQTLYTYFDGGFLFNVDKELERTQDGYKKGRIFEEGREILSGILASESGMKAVASESLATGEGVLAASKEAQEAFAKNRAHLSKSCPSSYGALAQ
jgi:hypothetical protein